MADRLVAVGLVSPEAFEGVTSEDLMGLGFTSEEAATVLEKVASSDDESSGDTDEAPDVADEASEETVSDSDETKEGEETA